MLIPSGLLSTPLFVTFSIFVGVARAESPVFLDRTADAGVDVVSRCGAPPRLFIAESNGCGAAWLDFDGDGDLDLYVVNGNGLESLDGGRLLPIRFVHTAPTTSLWARTQSSARSLWISFNQR